MEQNFYFESVEGFLRHCYVQYGMTYKEAVKHLRGRVAAVARDHKAFMGEEAYNHGRCFQSSTWHLGNKQEVR
jgi:hypothetical protein